MTTVREATFDLFRAHGMTTVFGNPGSTELPMLRDFPEDFSYILGLQELVVLGMADEFAQASGRPAHVNLHTAPGVGNAIGGIFNAQANKSPLLITAGQQVRPQITMEANLTNREAALGPQPYVKWSYEPPRAQDVPQAMAPAIHHASRRPGVRIDPHGRLGGRGGWGVGEERACARRDGSRDAGPGRARRPRPTAPPGAQARARRGPGHRRERRLGHGGGARREAAAAGVGGARPGGRATGLPGGSREPPRHPAAGDRPGLGDPARPRPRARGGLLGVSLLPLHPGLAPPRGNLARADHERPERGGTRADGQCDRGRRRPRARASAGAARALRATGAETPATARRARR